jgi:hypothetical protein
MAGNTTVYKRCGCVDPTTGKRRGCYCPYLAREGHGSWYFRCRTREQFGRPQLIRRGGYRTKTEADRARARLLMASAPERMAAQWTVAKWLRHWLSLYGAKTRRTGCELLIRCQGGEWRACLSGCCT